MSGGKYSLKSCQNLLSEFLNELSNPTKVDTKISDNVIDEDDLDIKIIDDIKSKLKEEVKKCDVFICDCKEVDKHVSSHYCMQCDKGFCRFWIKSHQRFLKHNLLQINYYCKCQTEEKNSASKYCQDCLEAFCTNCANAHESFTQNHILLKTIPQ